MEKEVNFSPSDEVMKVKAISESNRIVLHHQSIGKTLDQLHNNANSVLSLTAQLKAIEDHFNSTHASIQERAKDLDSMQESLKEKFKELEAKEEELGRVQEGLKRKEEELEERIKGYGMKKGELENAKGEDFTGTLVKIEAPDANRGGCVTIDGRWLQTYLNEHSEELDLKRTEVEVFLRLSSDPAQLVLDTIEGFFSPSLMKVDVAFDERIVRRSCILLLELMFKISPEIKHCVKKEMLRIASEWVKKVGKDSENSLWEVVANVGETLDGKWLQMYLNDHSEELDLMRSEVEVALRLSLDPAQVVLDAIKGFYPPHLMKGYVGFEEGVVRRSCILLLELLSKISLEIKPRVQEEARRIAHQWMKKMRKDAEHSVEVFGFLKLVGSFGLTSAFDANELLNYLAVVAQPRQAPELFRLLGLADRKRSFVKNLIRNNNQLEVIRFSYSLEIIHDFPPGPLLKDFLMQSHCEARKFRKRSPCERIAATEKRISEIRDVLKCIEEFKIEEKSPELSPKRLQNVVSCLEREIANMKAMQLAVSAPNLTLTAGPALNTTLTSISTASPAAQVIVSSLSPTDHNPTTKFTLPSVTAPFSGPSSVSQTLSTTAPATLTSPSSPAGQVTVSSLSPISHKPTTKFTFPSLSRPFSSSIFSSQSQTLSTTAPNMITFSSSSAAQVTASSLSPTDHNPATKFTFPSLAAPLSGSIFSSSLRTLSTSFPNMVASSSSSAGQVTVSSLSPTSHKPATKFTFPSRSRPFSGSIFSSQSQTLSTTAPNMISSSSSSAAQVTASSLSPTDHNPATKFTFPSLAAPLSGSIFSSSLQTLSTSFPNMVTSSSSSAAQVTVSSLSPTDDNPTIKFAFSSQTTPFKFSFLTQTAPLSGSIFSSSLRTLSTSAPNMATSSSSSAAQVTVSSSLCPTDDNPSIKFTSSSQTTPFKFNFPSQTAPFSGPMFSSLSRTSLTTTPVTVNSFSSLSKALLTTAPVTVSSSSPAAPSASTLMAQPQPLVKNRCPRKPKKWIRNKRARVVESAGLASTAGPALKTLTYVSTASPSAQVSISSQTAPLSCPIVSSPSQALSTTAPAVTITSSPPADRQLPLLLSQLLPQQAPTSDSTLMTQPQPLAIYRSPRRSQHRGRNQHARVGESAGLHANYGMPDYTPAVDYIWVPVYHAPFGPRYSPYHMPFHSRRH